MSVVTPLRNPALNDLSGDNTLCTIHHIKYSYNDMTMVIIHLVYNYMTMVIKYSVQLYDDGFL